MGNVRLRGESVSSEHDLSRSLCRCQSDPSFDPRMKLADTFPFRQRMVFKPEGAGLQWIYPKFCHHSSSFPQRWICDDGCRIEAQRKKMAAVIRCARVFGPLA